MDLPKIGKPAPIVKGKAVLNNTVLDLSSSYYKDKYIVLLFYPMDFVHVSRTELFAFSDRLDDFTKLNTVVLACATESYLAHKKWLSMLQKEGGVSGLKFPLIADKTMEITKKFGVLNEEEGIAYPAMFIIDDKGILRQITINDRPVGRNINEVRRLIKTIQRPEKIQEDTSTTDFLEVAPAILHKARSLISLEKALARELAE